MKVQIVRFLGTVFLVSLLLGCAGSQLNPRPIPGYQEFAVGFEEDFADQFGDKSAARKAWRKGGGAALARIYDEIYPPVSMEKFSEKALLALSLAREKYPTANLEALSFVGLDGLMDEREILQGKHSIEIYERSHLQRYSSVPEGFFDVIEWPEIDKYDPNVSTGLEVISHENFVRILMPSWTGDYVSDFYQVLKSVSQSDNDVLVLDMRSNTGGTLETLIELADIFLARGLFRVEGNLGNYSNHYLDQHKIDLSEKRIVILVNEKTNSGALSLAIALKQSGLANLIGKLAFEIVDTIRTEFRPAYCGDARRGCRVVVPTGRLRLPSGDFPADVAEVDMTVDWETDTVESVVRKWLLLRTN